MKPLKPFLRISAAAIALSVGACAAGADRTVLDVVRLKQPEPPTLTEQPTTTGDIKSRVGWDGYPDPDFVPNPERLPELSEEERAAIEEDLKETGRARLENRVLTCGATNPGDCVQ